MGTQAELGPEPEVGGTKTQEGGWEGRSFSFSTGGLDKSCQHTACFPAPPHPAQLKEEFGPMMAKVPSSYKTQGPGRWVVSFAEVCPQGCFLRGGDLQAPSLVEG